MFLSYWKVINLTFLETFIPLNLTYASRLGNRGWKLGLRGEYVKEQGLSGRNVCLEKSYFFLYPSAHLTYDLTPKNQFSLNYSRLVIRPSMFQINLSPLSTFQRKASR
ncbi:MAG: outer membrane beta-barrel protein [Flavobacteriales bacterium AspAUS03]